MASSFICNRSLVLVVVILTVVADHFGDAQRAVLVEGPKKKVVILGGTTELKCTVSTQIRWFGLLHVQWKHLASDKVYTNRDDCSYTDRTVCVENRVEGDRLTTLLKIRNVQLEDAGAYSCEYALDGSDVFTFLAEGTVAVSSPATAPVTEDSSNCTNATSTPQLQGPPPGTISQGVKLAVITAASSCLLVGLVIGLVVLLLCKRRRRGLSSQQLDQAIEQGNQALSRTRTQIGEGPTYVNEAPLKVGAQQSSCGGLVVKYQHTGPAIKAGLSSKRVYENAPCCKTDNDDATVAQRAVPSSSTKDTREDQQVYMNHRVIGGKLHQGPQK